MATARKPSAKATTARKAEPATEPAAESEPQEAAASAAPTQVETAETAAPPPQPAARSRSGAGFAEQTGQVGADARALAAATQEALSALNSRCVALIRDDTGEHPASADAVQRLPMAATDLFRALRAYGAVAAELAAAAQR